MPPTPSTDPETFARAMALHEEIRAACADHHQTEHALAVLLARMSDERLYVAMGFRSVVRYASVALDLPAKKARTLKEIGLRMRDLPELAAAFASGEIGWTKAREIIRVANAENVETWVDLARDTNSRQLEAQVSAALGQPKRRARTRLVFELDPAEAADLELAITLEIARCPERGTDRGAALAHIARRILAEHVQEEVSADLDAAPLAETREQARPSQSAAESPTTGPQPDHTARAVRSEVATQQDTLHDPDRDAAADAGPPVGFVRRILGELLPNPSWRSRARRLRRNEREEPRAPASEAGTRTVTSGAASGDVPVFGGVSRRDGLRSFHVGSVDPP